MSLALFFTLFFVYSNCQMRPQNWDMDILKFDQRDWNKFGQDFGQNNRPFPSFSRPKQIPTQQPPIVGQIPGQIGKGQRGQSGNDNDPPPLPPMPRQPGQTPTDQNPPPMLPEPGTDLEEPPPGGSTTSYPTSQPDNGNQPPLPTPIPPGPEMETTPDQVPEVEDQSQAPPPEQLPEAGNEGVDPTEMDGSNQSETPLPMDPTASPEGRESTTLGDMDQGEVQIPGFSFGQNMGGQIGESGPAIGKEQFGISGDGDVLPSFEDKSSRSEPRGVIAVPKGSFGHNGDAVMSKKGAVGKNPRDMGVLAINGVLSTPLPILRSPHQGVGEGGDLEGMEQRMGVVSKGSRPPRGR